MEFLQEIAISHGIHFNPAYMHTLHVMQEHSPSIEAAAINVFARSGQHNVYNGGLVSPDYHHQLAEGMDETTLLQPPSNPHLHNIDSLITNSVGLSTNNSTRHQFCEVSNTGSASVAAHLPCTIKRRSWQEALSSPKIDMSTSTQLHLVDMHPRVECTSVDNILNLQHIQAGATNHSTNYPNYLMPKTLLTSSATHKMPLEESLIAAHEKGIPAQNPNRRSFLSALSEGDEAFFKQQLLVPMEGICIDVPIKQGATVSNDREEQNLSIAQLWIHNQSSSGITDRSSTPSKNMSNKSIGSSCVNMCMSSKDNDEKSRASQEMNALRAAKEDIARMCTSINIDSSRSEAQYDMGKINVNGGSINQKAALPHIMNPLEALDSKKRSFADHASAACNMTHSKRAHLGPDHGKHSNNNNMMKHSSSSSSLNNMSDSNIDTHKSSSLHSSKSSAKSSSRNQLGPALNTNLKPRARHGTANDPQTLAARNRRERINARLKVLQELVPNGSKVDLVTMLEKAINYVKFLQLQLRVLSNDEFWQANQLEKVAMQHVLSMDVEEDNFNNSDHLTVCEHTSMSCTTNNTFIDQL